ncbi:MAG: hypothetical protein JXP73_16055 [Deltaproteobacteria bacterium]|jgi:hypothetical protein|nr:hypothetical protein [Deltaproteobacteria bacterium]
MPTIAEVYASLKIPPATGSLRRERPPSDSLVAVVEDIYCNPPVQARIAQALEHLVEHNGFRLLNVEGNFHELPLRRLRHLTAERLAEMMEQGQVTGPERVGILSEEAVSVIGVDDCRLYRRNHQVMKVVMDNQKTLAPLLEALDRCGPSPMASLFGMDRGREDLSAEERRTAATLARLLRVQADNRDVDYAKQHLAAFAAPAIAKIVGPRTAGLEILESTLFAALEFYALARARQAAFVTGTLANMRRHNTDRSALVVGNFHTAGVLSLLARKEIGCLLISPSARGAADSDLYFDRMREQA